MEVFSQESYNGALRARAEGWFDRKNMPMDGAQRDETPRVTTLETLPGFPEHHRRDRQPDLRCRRGCGDNRRVGGGGVANVTIIERLN